MLNENINIMFVDMYNKNIHIMFVEKSRIKT